MIELGYGIAALLLAAGLLWAFIDMAWSKRK